MNKNEVDIAFEILFEEIEKVFNAIKQEGKSAFEKQDFEKIKTLTKNGKQLKKFIKKLKRLYEEWKNIFSTTIQKSKGKQEKRGRLKRGLRTPENKFIIPILQSLVELGGKAKMKEVFDKVYEKMKFILKPYDFQHLKSKPSSKRWQNTTQWARNTMVNKGLLSSDSPRGIWEITEKGRKYIEEKKVI